jgi:hypothetical protein
VSVIVGTPVAATVANETMTLCPAATAVAVVTVHGDA